MSYKSSLIILCFLFSCAHLNSTNTVKLEKNIDPLAERTLDRTPSADSSITSKNLYTLEINSDDDFKILAQQSNGVIRQGETIKLFIDNRNNQKPAVYFMNANYCPTQKCETPPQEAVFHYYFAKKTLKNFNTNEAEYNQSAYYTKTIAERQFFDVRIQRFKMKVDQVEKTFYGLRFIERDLVNNQMIQHALAAILPHFHIPNQNLAIILNSQAQTVETIKPWLESQQISIFTMENILSGVSYIGLNPGTAYGYLRVFPKNEEDLDPQDIPVFQTLPLDLSVVAGTISTEFQDAGSHINLKSKERGTPNMVIREATDIQKLLELNNRPVKLVVNYSGYSITESSDQEVMTEYKKKLNTPWIQVAHVNKTQLLGFDEMCKGESARFCLEQSRAYGGKVAGLGFLAHTTVAGLGSPLQKKYKYQLTPIGFGVPLSFYDEFMKENLARNPELKNLYNLLIESEMGINQRPPLKAEERKELIDNIKKLIITSPIPQTIYQQVYNRALKLSEEVKQQYPGVELDQIKLRSSSNAEDIKGFNGAGLHDSYSAKLSKSTLQDFSQTNCSYKLDTDADTGLTEEDIHPKTIACAMKATYASLWNLRAVRERTFKRFDQRTASMGLSVQTAYKFRKGLEITSNSVMVTRVLGAESVYGQQLSTQVGNGLVTNPVPNTKSELVVIGFDNTAKNFGISLLQYAKPIADKPALTELILSHQQMMNLSEIARTIEIRYCESKNDYFPGAKCSAVVNSVKKPTALDMEFKLYNNGEILIKQVRTFTGK